MLRFLPLLLALACASRPSPPLVEAHRTGAGYWPENSRHGVEAALVADFDGIEVDLVLTRDLIPVLHHDPAVSTEHCTMADGSRVPKDYLIRDHTFAELEAQVRCGGTPVEAFPEALVLEDSLLSFDEMLLMIRELGSDDIVIHLDVKQEPGITLPVEAYAEAIVGRWVQADLPQRVHVSSNLPDVLIGFRSEGSLHGISLETTLIWPRFPVGGSTSAVALRREGALLAGTEDYVALADEAGADHIALQWELADRHLAAVAQKEGIGVMLWTPDDPDLLDKLSRRWPVDVIITDYPGDLP